MIKFIYVDMDGVLADFVKGYQELFGEHPGAPGSDTFDKNREAFIKSGAYATLDNMDDAGRLVSYLKKLHKEHHIRLHVLSSVGSNHPWAVDVVEQKLSWLYARDYQVGWSFDCAFFTTGGHKKANFASSNSLLIDDTPDVVENFRKVGGHAILHENASCTIHELMKLLKIE